MTDSNPTSEPDRRPLILVVDDEPAVRAMVLAAIRVGGPNYRIAEAARAEEAENERVRA